MLSSLAGCHTGAKKISGYLAAVYEHSRRAGRDIHKKPRHFLFIQFYIRKALSKGVGNID
jgi:hypothetical protein